ncbi:cupin domain-containing protein [Sorangium sp. So ce1024]|uniref:cupin domain-containing protein n=1 Tax=unclassified Sorangium TaxID=2621164 RepID=UPI003F0F1232
MALRSPEGVEGHARAPLAETQRVCEGMTLTLVETARLRGGPAPVRMSRFELAPGARSPLDVHEEREMWMLAQGHGALSYRGQPPFPVRAGDVVAFEAGASHTLANTGSEPLVVFSIWWGDPA